MCCGKMFCCPNSIGIKLEAQFETFFSQLITFKKLFVSHAKETYLIDGSHLSIYTGKSSM